MSIWRPLSVECSSSQMGGPILICGHIARLVNLFDNSKFGVGNCCPENFKTKI